MNMPQPSHVPLATVLCSAAWTVIMILMTPTSLAQDAGPAQIGPWRVTPGTTWHTIGHAGETGYLGVEHDALPGEQFIIRIPEYANLYQSLHLVPATWQRLDERTLEMTWSAPLDVQAEHQVARSATFRFGDDVIDITATIRNPSDRPWGHERYDMYDVMTRNAPAFRDDPRGQRTYVYRQNRWAPVGSFPIEGLEQRLTGSLSLADDPAHPGELEITERVMAKVSEDGRWVLGIASDDGNGVSFNLDPGTGCIHQNPYWGKLDAGESRTSHLRVYLINGSLDDLWHRYQQGVPPTQVQATDAPAPEPAWVRDRNDPYAFFMYPDEGRTTTNGTITLAPLTTMAYVEMRHADLPGQNPILRIPEYLDNSMAYINANMVWSVSEPGVLHYRYAPDAVELAEQRIAFEGTVRAVDDGAQVTVQIWNPTEKPWPSVDYWIYELINRNASAFHDPTGRNVYVRRNDGFVTLHELWEGDYPPSFNGSMALAKPGEPPPPRAVTAPLIAAVSEDGRWITAVAVDPPGNVGFNINPGTYGLVNNVTWGQLRPGEKRTARLKFYFFEGSLNGLWRKFNDDAFLRQN